MPSADMSKPASGECLLTKDFLGVSVPLSKHTKYTVYVDVIFVQFEERHRVAPVSFGSQFSILRITDRKCYRLVSDRTRRLFAFSKFFLHGAAGKHFHNGRILLIASVGLYRVGD